MFVVVILGSFGPPDETLIHLSNVGSPGIPDNQCVHIQPEIKQESNYCLSPTKIGYDSK